MKESTVNWSPCPYDLVWLICCCCADHCLELVTFLYLNVVGACDCVILLQDFPAKGPGAAAITPFESDLADYLSALKLPSATSRQLQQIVARHDFSSARVQLLASVPGYHSGALKLHAYGHMRLRALLSAEDIAPEFRAAHTIMQCSSLGSLDDKWLMQEFLSSCTAGNYAAQSAAAGE